MFMRRLLLPFLLLLTTGAIATIPPLRDVAIAQWRSIAMPLFQRGDSTDPHFDAFYAEMVEDLPPQQRAERALELAINRSVGAAEYVTAQAASWIGTIKSTPQLDALVRTAVNAPLLETRMAGFEVFLASFRLHKTTDEVDRLLADWQRDPAQNGPWMMWSLAALGARGIDRERIFARLLETTREPDPALRKAAVDAMARLGGSEIVSPLLYIAEHDASPMVRERAFCALATGGTLLIAERYQAVPGLLAIAESAHSDQQTRDWTYQALKEITLLWGLPPDPGIWRQRLAAVGLLAER